MSNDNWHTSITSVPPEPTSNPPDTPLETHEPRLLDSGGHEIHLPKIEAQQKSTRWDTTKRCVDLVSGIAVILTMFFIALQWHEMRSSSADTHDLAVAAKSQADAATMSLEELKKSVADTHGLALAARDQAVATKKQVEISAKQLKEIQRSGIDTQNLARAARDQADTMKTLSLISDKQRLLSEQALDAQKKAWEAQNRPWIGFEIKGTLLMEGNDAKTAALKVQLVITDYGRTPAILDGYPQLLLAYLGKTEPRFWPKAFCSGYDNLGGQPKLPRFPQPIFPSSPTEYRLMSVSPQDDPNARSSAKYLSICIPYESSQHEHYLSRAIYWVHYPDNGVGSAPGQPSVEVERTYFDVVDAQGNSNLQ